VGDVHLALGASDMLRAMADGFNNAYVEGSAPWDIGRAQPAFVRLLDSGRIRGRVIELGCGTGENALQFARSGLDVVGVDGSPEAIRQAQIKAADTGASATFEIGDVLDLDGDAERFDTATDSGVFHVFEDEDRPRYSASVLRVLRPGGRLFILCFSERQPGDWGPRRVTQRELRGTFTDGWSIESIDEAHFDIQLGEMTEVAAWLASITRR
jgi:ubiquinone/menaquinone biosynthesis C-methylase UbiE